MVTAEAMSSSLDMTKTGCQTLNEREILGIKHERFDQPKIGMQATKMVNIFAQVDRKGP